MADAARKTAFEAASRVIGGAYSNLLSFDKLEKRIDRAFAESIFLTTLERRITLTHIAEKYIKKETKSELLTLILTGLCQIFYMTKVPDSAACDETTEIAREVFGYDASRFVNAVLRSACRDREIIEKEIENGEEYIKYSVGKELFALIREQYPDNYKEIFEAFFGKSRCFLRVNTLKAKAEEVAKTVGGSVVNEKTVVCDAADAVNHLGSSWFYIQGYGSQEASSALGAKKGETVIDVCACPGGKSLSAAINMVNEGKIYSFDIHENKLSLIEKSAKKLGISIITAEKHDGKSAKSELIGKADRVICDVPCSGTGEIGSKPEIRNKKPEDFERLYETQRAIAVSSAKYLKIGGTMVYSTCSINKKENEEAVKVLLSSDETLVSVEERTILPSFEIPEGFYYNVIKRIK